ncbi:hypothetical protein, partial [Finegoldia magna]|uniref:hypothetical protein n=1 Tax=Finegoldia magna TaxID=1260 RepID=UPI0023A94790
MWKNRRNQKTDLHEHMDEKIYRNTKIMNKSRNTLRLAYVNRFPRLLQLRANQKTVLHEYLLTKIKKSS